jgi:HAD superfamily hydrolase (TIGR01456 family)
MNSSLPSFAFAFEYAATLPNSPSKSAELTPSSIDGVLLRSSKNLPGATKALQFLHKHNIPFILLTNGGGKHETDRVVELTKKFGVPLTVENFVQSHTPFQELVHGTETHDSLSDKTVLVTGGNPEVCRTIAERYGFKSVVTPGDILIAHPKIWPFNEVWTDYYTSTAKPLPKPINPTNLSSSLKIDAVFVFNDPRDWALDTQIILDLLLSHQGYLGTYSEKNGDEKLPNKGWQQDGQPALFFSNPDLFWAAGYHMPRLGQGGFRAALEGVWRDVTDGAAPLRRKVIGKPYKETYAFAERVLREHRAELLERDSGEEVPKLERVFMVGDNPESDIRGANEFVSPEGTEWCSVLVETGVHRRGERPKYRPRAIREDVLDAVRWALQNEGFEFEEGELSHEVHAPTMDVDV